MSLTAAQARSLVARANTSMAATAAAVEELWHERAWTVLGYDSWETLCRSEFQLVQGQLQGEMRARLIAAMTEIGMSIRAQAHVAGVSKDTVRRAQVAQNATPESVVGTDGKRYTPQRSLPERERGPEPAAESDPPIDELVDIVVTVRLSHRARVMSRIESMRGVEALRIDMPVERHHDAG